TKRMVTELALTNAITTDSDAFVSGGTSRPAKICCCHHAVTDAMVLPITSLVNSSRTRDPSGRSTARAGEPSGNLVDFFRNSFAASALSMDVSRFAGLTMIRKPPSLTAAAATKSARTAAAEVRRRMSDLPSEGIEDSHVQLVVLASGDGGEPCVPSIAGPVRVLDFPDEVPSDRNVQSGYVRRGALFRRGELGIDRLPLEIRRDAVLERVAHFCHVTELFRRQRGARNAPSAACHFVQKLP